MLFYFEIVEQISLIVSRPLHFKEQNSSIIGQGEERERRGRERRGRERKGEERKGEKRRGEKGRGEEYKYLHSSILIYEITPMIQSATNYLLVL